MCRALYWGLNNRKPSTVSASKSLQPDFGPLPFVTVHSGAPGVVLYRENGKGNRSKNGQFLDSVGK